MDNHEAPKTLDVPTAGRRYFNLGRNGSYRAAKRGEIPTIKIGNRLLMPVVVLDRMLSEVGSCLSGDNRDAKAIKALPEINASKAA